MSDSLTTGRWSAVGMNLGVDEIQTCTSSAPETASAVYYRILRIPRTSPRDQDSDGIDDVYELSHTALDPLNSADAGYDADGDGADNLREYQRGTSPDDSSSKNVTIYTDSAVGNDSFDGLSPTPTSAGRGPKQELGAAVGAAIDGDDVQLAEGMYDGSAFEQITNSLTFEATGDVEFQ